MTLQKTLVALSFLCLITFSLTALHFLITDSPEAEAKIVTVERPVLDEEEIEVLIPTQTILSGMVLEPHLFKRERRRALEVPIAVVKDFEEIRGRYARASIPANLPLQRQQTTDRRPINAVVANIPEGYRAVTISVDARTSVEGWARPGSRVDVSWMSKLRGQTGIKVIAHNALILSAERTTNENVREGAPVPTTVTLLVTADDAARISLATTTGSLTMALRGDSDRGKSGVVSNLTVKDLLANAESDKPATENIQGVAKFTTASGKVKEWVVIDGNVVAKANEPKP